MIEKKGHREKISFVADKGLQKGKRFTNRKFLYFIHHVQTRP